MTTGIQYVEVAVMDEKGRMLFESTVATKREAIENRGLAAFAECFNESRWVSVRSVSR